MDYLLYQKGGGLNKDEYFMQLKVCYYLLFFIFNFIKILMLMKDYCM